MPAPRPPGALRAPAGRAALPPGVAEAARDAAHLKRAVQLWDLPERHLDVSGPGADALMREITPRDLARVPDGRRAYLPVCGPGGRLLGDPMAFRVGPDEWRLSGRADLGPWIRTVARASRLPVLALPAEAEALALQGPLAEELARRVLGPAPGELGPMGWTRARHGDDELILARSDLSRQGGFEVVGRGLGVLRAALIEAGAGLDMRACPPSELARVEGGLLLWGVDIGPDLTPFEAGLGRLCDGRHDHIGRAALRAAREPRRRLRPVEIDGPPLAPPAEPWPIEGGRITSAAWSPEHGVHLAIALVSGALPPGAALAVATPYGPREGRVRDTFLT